MDREMTLRLVTTPPPPSPPSPWLGGCNTCALPSRPGIRNREHRTPPSLLSLSSPNGVVQRLSETKNEDLLGALHARTHAHALQTPM